MNRLSEAAAATFARGALGMLVVAASSCLSCDEGAADREPSLEAGVSQVYADDALSGLPPVLGVVVIPSGQTQLGPEAVTLIAENAESILEWGYRVRLEGLEPNEATQVKLDVAHAELVRDLLIEEGVPSDWVEIDREERTTDMLRAELYLFRFDSMDPRVTFHVVRMGPPIEGPN